MSPMVLSGQVGGRLPPDSKGSDSNRARFKGRTTQAKRQQLRLKAKFFFTTVIYNLLIRVKVSSLAKFTLAYQSSEFRHN